MKLFVLGGGTAGSLTALFLKKVLPQSEITLLQSSEIGVVGVGEATTPQIIDFLKFVDIHPFDVFAYCNGTVKQGISFENWNGDGEKYFHGFYDNLADFQVGNSFSRDSYSFYLKNSIAQGLDLKKYVYSAHLSYQNKVDLNQVTYALHFDTNLFSYFLQRVAEFRGVKILEGKFKSALENQKGNISTIVLEDGSEIETDFVFDCSGFSRLLIGKHFKQDWISFKDSLPAKQAISFYLDQEEDFIPPYTAAIAMKYGWVWKIPLQDRFGCGYVYDTDYINAEQAQKELEETFKKEIKVNKVIDFNAGMYDKFWVKNVVAVGLSSSFIEPLESTSIYLTVAQLMAFNFFLNEIKETSDLSRDLFNKMMRSNMEQVLGFVYLHYITKRKDTDFWKNFQEKYVCPKFFEEKLQLILESNIRFQSVEDDKSSPIFGEPSFLEVCDGLGLLKNINIENYTELNPSIENYKYYLDMNVLRAPEHLEFLRSLAQQNQQN